MKLTVVTHTRGTRPNTLERCVRSVERALPPGAEHKIIYTQTREEWVRSRLEVVYASDVICFVDDDDEIHPDSLTECVALMKPDVGVVCTNEVLVFPNGREVYNTQPKTYVGVARSPTEIHHLCMINSAFVRNDLHSIAGATNGVGVDWLIKASAALTGGALHLQMPGYYWYVGSADSDCVEYQNAYHQHVLTIQREIEGWGSGRIGVVPTALFSTARQATS